MSPWIQKIAIVGALAASVAACGTEAGSLPDTVLTEGLDSEHGHFRVHIEVDSAGIQRGVNRFSVRVEDRLGRPAELLAIRATMPLHAHSTVLGSVLPGENGLYVVDRLELNMAGQWELDMALMASDNATEDHAGALVTVE